MSSSLAVLADGGDFVRRSLAEIAVSVFRFRPFKAISGRAPKTPEDLPARGLLGEPLVIAYVVAVALHRQAVIALRASGGAVVMTKTATWFKNPWLSIQNRQALISPKCASEMGLTPVSRAVLAARMREAGGAFAEAWGRARWKIPSRKAGQDRLELAAAVHLPRGLLAVMVAPKALQVTPVQTARLP